MPTLGEQVAALKSRFDAFEKDNTKEHAEFVTQDQMQLALTSVKPVTTDQMVTAFTQALETRGIGGIPPKDKLDAATKVKVALIGVAGSAIVGILSFLAGKGGHP